MGLRFKEYFDAAVQFGLDYWLIITVISAAVAVVSMALTVFVLTRLPPDRFVSGRRAKPRSRLWRVSVTIIGVLLILVGVVLLFLPGQGLLVLLAGIFLLEFPKKDAFFVWLLKKSRSVPAINRLRAKRGREPLQIP